MIKGVIFDWGRTIWDTDHKRPFPETKAVLEYCVKKYTLAIVSIAGDGNIEQRYAWLDQYDLRKYFQFALFHPTDKDVLYRIAFGNLQIPPNDITVVDDRVQRMTIPIRAGCTTLWLHKGKFAHELPDPLIGYPTHEITALSDVIKIL